MKRHLMLILLLGFTMAIPNGWAAYYYVVSDAKSVTLSDCSVDCGTGVRKASSVLPLRYSSRWSSGYTTVLKANGKCILEDYGEGVVLYDLARSNSDRVVLTHECGGETLSAEFLVSQKEQDFAICAAGWHEVSFAVLPEGGDPADVFAPVADKIGYVTCGSENWSPATGGTLMALEIGKGYWVQTTAADVSWTVTGQGNPGVEIALKAGWNLIGYPLLEEGSVETVLATALATDKIDYIYSGSRVYPGTLTTLTPGKGYWVYANAAVTIRFDFE